MKHIALSLLLLTPTLAKADASGVVLDAGLWTCERVVDVFDNGPLTDLEKMKGWVSGFWTALTYFRDDGFDAAVDAAGGSRIMDITFEECLLNVPKDTLLIEVSKMLVDRTG